MLKFVFRVLRFSGTYAKRLKLSFVLSVIEGLLQSVPIVMVWLAFNKLLSNTLVTNDALIFGIVIFVSICIRILLRYWFVALESGAGYEICEKERIALGDKLRNFPMSFFSEGNLGNVTSVITVDLPFIEEMGMDALDKVIGGYATSLIGFILLLAVDWRIGAITLVAFLLAAFAFLRLENICRRQSPIRQKQQARLVGAILEYVRGISVIKAFHMGGDKAENVKDAIETTRNHSIDFEVQLVWPVIWYKICFALGMASTILAASLFALAGQLTVSTSIAIFIFVFTLYMPATAFASLSSQLRVMEAGLDRYEALNRVEHMQEGSKENRPSHFDIRFDNVDFSYGDAKILENASFTIPERTVTALVGPSGGGKTTIANLIVRFWDAQKGSVQIGGIDIKEMGSDTLLSNISMVFQNVYLFNDTIKNNIRFGKPSATDEEIMEAAKKARCHDFIMALPEGYHTVAGESGGSLSGGERQRISIARAILKDSPIIILDEATA